jgi:hypothetical protein
VAQPPAEIAPAGVARNLASFARLTRRYEGAARGRVREVVLAARDPFSIQRPGNALTRLDGFLAGLGKTSGETRLAGFDRWEAQDTLDGWVRTFFGKRDLAPLAWGRATAARTPTRGDYWCGPSQPQAGRCRWSWTWAWGSTHALGGFLGLPALRDVSDPRDHDPQANFLVVTQLPLVNLGRAPGHGTAAALGATGAVGAAGGAGAADRPAAGAAAPQRLLAAALARVHFVRPSDPRDRTAATLLRADGAVEYGNLFNPYWQARLAPLPLDERLRWLAPLGVPASWLAAAGPR